MFARHTPLTMFRALLLLPFLALQLVAPGTMAQAGPDGLRMVLCTSDGAISVIVHDDGSITHPPPAQAHDPCPWSTTLDTGTLAAHAVPRATLGLIQSPSPVMPLPRALGHLHTGPPSRAPPFIA